jgi:hypothetical protein
MTTPKNPAAVALGRRGGQAKVSKGPNAAKTPAERAEWAAKMVAARRAKATAAAPTPGKPPATGAGRSRRFSGARRIQPVHALLADRWRFVVSGGQKK